MKLTTSLVVFAALGFVSPSQIPTGLGMNSVGANLKRHVDLSWDPVGAYEKQSKTRKPHWEQACRKAFASAGCTVGTIHLGETRVTLPNKKQTSYVNVEGAPTKEMMENPKKMRVYSDGSLEEFPDWTAEDRKHMARMKTKFRSWTRQRLWDQKSPTPSEDSGAQPEKSQMPLLTWDPPEGNARYRKKRSRWEQVCGEALARVDCHVGTIHLGETKVPLPNGGEATYVNVEGAPSTDMLKNPKRMRVYSDGSTEDFTEKGWTQKDRRHMMVIKGSARLRKKIKIMPVEKPGTQINLSWEPPNPPERYRKKKIRWEATCGEALTRAGCQVGTIFQVERKLTKPNGQLTTYVNVEGAPSMDMMKKNPRKMRVFWDGSTEDFTKDGWNDLDRKNISQTRWKYNQRMQDERKRPPVEQKTILMWDPPNAYESTQKKRLRWEQTCGGVFAKVGCQVGIIYRGKLKLTRPNGDKTFYVNVSGAPLMNMQDWRKLRVFQDGEYEDRTKEGWTERDRKSIERSKQPTGQQNESSTIIQATQKPSRAEKRARKGLDQSPANEGPRKRRKKDGVTAEQGPLREPFQEPAQSAGGESFPALSPLTHPSPHGTEYPYSDAYLGAHSGQFHAQAFLDPGAGEYRYPDSSWGAHPVQFQPFLERPQSGNSFSF